MSEPRNFPQDTPIWCAVLFVVIMAPVVIAKHDVQIGAFFGRFVTGFTGSAR